jgi:hypothetical protein
LGGFRNLVTIPFLHFTALKDGFEIVLMPESKGKDKLTFHLRAQEESNCGTGGAEFLTIKS